MSTEEDMGSLGGGMRDPWDDAEPAAPEHDALLERVTGDEATSGGGLTPQKVSIPEPQPVNQATHMCTRGPCVHLWELVKRYESTVDGISSACIWTCTASGYEDTPLNDQNIYYCDRWWPRAPLLTDDGEEWDHDDITLFSGLGELVVAGIDRAAVRGRWRPKLHELWEQGLRELGYDFSWRDDEYRTKYHADDPHSRKFSGIGGREAARRALEEQRVGPPASVPADEPEPEDDEQPVAPVTEDDDA